MITCERTLTTR